LLALVLVLSQVHFCEAVYVAATGNECRECLEIPVHGDEGALSEEHGDCHDCCELEVCEAPNGAEIPASAMQISWEFGILPEPPVLPAIERLPRLTQRFVFASGAPPTGPPRTRLTRGPPTPCFVQSSAGSRVIPMA